MICNEMKPEPDLSQVLANQVLINQVLFPMEQELYVCMID
jgi:hypothetical protein